MELFSQRKGFKPAKSVIQVDSMDNELRNSLWNALTLFYWDTVNEFNIPADQKSSLLTLLINLWFNYFKRQLDTLKSFTIDWRRYYGWRPYIYLEIKHYFFKCEWFEVYDFIEFVANNYPDKKVNYDFMKFCNCVLERELSAYRFVGGRITQITSEEEIAEIEKALENSETLKPVNNHLKTALDLLGNRKSPDYRNSIKEAISAVEAICNLITGEKGTTLAQALSKIENKVSLHPALKKAFNNLYGYTSNAEGIRHALLNEPNLNFEDAKFMLVSCSAFINYLIGKASRAGIKI
jgi:hypothetical protein